MPADTEHRYEAAPLMDEQEAEKFQQSYQQDANATIKRTSCIRRIVFSPIWLFTTLCLLAAIVIQNTVHVTTSTSKIDKIHATELAALAPYIRTTTHRFHGAIRDSPPNGTLSVPDPSYDAKGRPFVGPPSAEIDAAWDHLTSSRYVRFLDSEVAFLHSDTGIPLLTPLEDPTSTWLKHDGFYGGPDMLHSLHCINALRKAIDHEYYGGMAGLDRDPSYQRMHIDHCIEQLRQGVLCHGDMTPVTLKPVKDETGEVWVLLGETERMHTCRNGVELAEKWQSMGGMEGRGRLHEVKE